MNELSVAFWGTVLFMAMFTFNWLRGRSMLDPAVAISAVWTATFCFITIMDDKLVGVSVTALLIFVLGLAWFSLGVALGKSTPFSMKTPRAYDARADRLILRLFLLVLVLAMPSYIYAIKKFSGAALFSPTFFFEVRLGMLHESANGARTPLIYNLVTLSSIAAMLAFALTESGRRSWLLTALIIILAFVYNLLTASKAGALNLAIILLVIYGIQRGRMPSVALLSASLLVVSVFGFVTVQRASSIGFIDTSFSASLNATLEELGNYVASGPVGFSVYLENPHLVQPVWSPWRFFERTANYFGDYFTIPDVHAAYVDIGGGKYYNTYTAFFSYFPEHGLLGVVGFMFILGAISGAAYRRACKERILWTLLYASIYSGIVMTIFSESLLLALNPILKSIIMGGIVMIVKHTRFQLKRDHRNNMKFVE